MIARLEQGEDIEFVDKFIRAEYDDLNNINVVLGNQTIDESLKLDLGIHFVEIMRIASPHSDDCLIIYSETDKVLFIGDALSVDYYNNGYLDLDLLAELKITLKNIDFNQVVMGHNNILSKIEILNIIEKLLNT